MAEPSLNIGDQRLSPVSRYSLDVIMRYIQCVEEKTLEENHPLLISLPSKKSASVWLSAGILRNKFEEDYIDIGKQVALEPGDYVRVYGSRAKIQAKTNENITLLFRNNTEVKVRQADYAHLISKANRGNLNTFQHFSRRKIREQENRNAVSRILDSEDSNLVVSNAVLKSRILCLTGYGDKGNLEDQLDSVNVYGENLSDAFGKDNNLILSPDLKDYEGIFSESDEEEQFRAYALGQMDYLNRRITEDDNDLVRELRESLEASQFTTDDFRSKLEELKELTDETDETNEDTETVDELIELFPGVRNTLPDYLRAVLVNDLEILQDYDKTIRKLLINNIPVVVLCDKNIDSEQDYQLLNDVLKQYPHIFRLNWDKEKVKACTGEAAAEEDFIDAELWNASVRYARQVIKLVESADNRADFYFYRLPREIYCLEGYDRMKQAYWNYQYPAACMIKNTPNQINRNQARHLTDNFRSVFNDIGNYLPEQLYQKIREYLDALDSIEDYHKELDYRDQVFRQRIDLPGNENLQIPQNYTSFDYVTNEPSEKLETISFPGEPFKEKRQKLLLESVVRFFIPDVKVLCWPYERIKIHRYLEKAIRSGSFTDNLPFYETAGPVNGSWINEEADLQSRLSEQITVEKVCEESADGQSTIKPNIPDFEQVENDLENHTHGQYRGSCQNDETECSLLYLSGGNILFLPLKSSIRVALPNREKGTGLKKLSFNQLRRGMTVCEINVDNNQVRDYARSIFNSRNNGSGPIEDLDIWRNHLRKLYQKKHQDIHELCQHLTNFNTLHQIGGSPELGNIKRWLFDEAEELIAPAHSNLWLIIAASHTDNSERLTTEQIRTKVEKIESAKMRMMQTNEYIRRKVKNSISERLKRRSSMSKSDETISVDGKLEAKVKLERIEEKEENTVPVKYSQTRKIINP